MVLNGGALQYTGAGVSTDRLFTLGTSGGTIDASGTARLNFSNAGAMAYTGSGSRILTLTGTNAALLNGVSNASNTIAALIADGAGGSTSVYKTGVGNWTLSNYNTFTGNTTVNNGILWAYNQFPAGNGNNLPQTIRNNTALGASTATATVDSGGTLAIWGNAGGSWITNLAGVTLNGGNLLGDDGHQTLNSPVTLTADSTIICRYWDKDFMITGPVTGSGNLTINISSLPGGLPNDWYTGGVVILAGSGNNWSGTTTINVEGTGGRSTLQIGNAGVGSMPLGSANTINLNAQLAFNTTNDITITDAAIVGSGTVANWGSGTITLNGNNPSFSGALWAGGGMSYAAIGLTTNPALNNGALRISNTSAVSNVASINLSGGISLARLELANGVTTPATATVALNGRNTMPTMPVGLSSISGNNTIGGTVSLTTGGNQFVIESKADTLTMNAVTNNSGDATPRYLFLQGAGTGVVNGIIGNGTGTGKLYVNKSGGGTWTLNAANTYTGDTTVNGGVLALGASGTISSSPLINVKSGTLDVSAAGSIALGASQTLAGAGAVNGSVTDAAGSTFSPGNSVGTLTINSNFTLAGSDNINYEIDGSNGDLLNVLGNLTLSGGAGTETVIAPTFVSPPTAASYTVASVPVTKTLTGTIAGVKVANQTRYTITPSVTSGAGGSVSLSVSGNNASLTWAGATGNSTWDVLNTSPWTGGGASNMFYQSDDVSFTDSPASVYSVTLNSTVKPMSVTISNNTATYSISGTGKISGSTGLTKSGTGTATLATTNDYTGTTTVTNGTLIVTGSVVSEQSCFDYRRHVEGEQRHGSWRQHLGHYRSHHH